jgi:hypothetical protein
LNISIWVPSIYVNPPKDLLLNNRPKDLQNGKIRNGNVEVEDKLAMMEVLSLCDTNGDDRLSLAEATICEIFLVVSVPLRDFKDRGMASYHRH